MIHAVSAFVIVWALVLYPSARVAVVVIAVCYALWLGISWGLWNFVG